MAHQIGDKRAARISRDRGYGVADRSEAEPVQTERGGIFS